MALNLDIHKSSKKEEIVTPLDGTPNPQSVTSAAGGRVLRIWYNTLLEYSGGEVKILRSYSVPAKDSDVQRLIKKKEEAKKPKTLAAPSIGGVEEW
jgi:hypothetical protein